jgi:hypothetical protein
MRSWGTTPAQWATARTGPEAKSRAMAPGATRLPYTVSGTMPRAARSPVAASRLATSASNKQEDGTWAGRSHCRGAPDPARCSSNEGCESALGCRLRLRYFRTFQAASGKISGNRQAAGLRARPGALQSPGGRFCVSIDRQAYRSNTTTKMISSIVPRPPPTYGPP